MDKTKTPETKKQEVNEASNLISKIYSNNNQKDYISEWNVEYLPSEKKINKPILFE